MFRGFCSFVLPTSNWTSTMNTDVEHVNFDNSIQRAPPNPAAALGQPAMLWSKLSVVARSLWFSDIFLECCFLICFVFVVFRLQELALNQFKIKRKGSWKSPRSSMRRPWCPKWIQVEQINSDFLALPFEIIFDTSSVGNLEKQLRIYHVFWGRLQIGIWNKLGVFFDICCCCW